MQAEIQQPDASGRILLNAGPSEAGAHRQELFRMCEQKYFYRVMDKMAVAVASIQEADRTEDVSAAETEKPHLIIGSLAHIGYAHYYARLRQWQQGKDPELYYSPTDAIEQLAVQHIGWGEHVGLSADLVQASVEFFPQDAKRYKILEVEQVHRLLVGGYDPRVAAEFGPNGFLYTQRVDLVWEDAAGRVFIVDHKGMGHFRGKEERVFCLSGQFLGYQMIGALTWGEKFGGVIANLFERKVDKPRFKRVPPLIAPWALRSFKENLIETELDMKRKHDGRDVWRHRKALSEQVCRTIYGECEHFERCRRGPRGV